ncbi:MAG: amidohydrolase family protein, partial [Anaerorhabdus sp.]
GIECAITRSTIGCDNPYRKEEALTIEQAIDSYTKNGAYASFEEKIKGKLEAGMLADFVVLDQNPYTVKPSEIHNIQVKMTIFDGKVVYMKS